MTEWSNVPVLKTGVWETGPWVRIPPLPHIEKTPFWVFFQYAEASEMSAHFACGIRKTFRSPITIGAKSTSRSIGESQDLLVIFSITRIRGGIRTPERYLFSRTNREAVSRPRFATINLESRANPTALLI